MGLLTCQRYTVLVPCCGQDGYRAQVSQYPIEITQQQIKPTKSTKEAQKHWQKIMEDFFYYVIIDQPYITHGSMDNVMKVK